MVAEREEAAQKWTKYIVYANGKVLVVQMLHHGKKQFIIA